MFGIFMTAVNAVAPIIILIVLGYVLKKINFLNGGFLKTGNKLVFNVLLPCMLFVNIYDNMDGFSAIRWDVVLFMVAVIAIIFAIGLICAIFGTKQRDRKGVILQCAFRSNFAIIGLTLVERLGGDKALAGIISAFSIPIFNILAVVALTMFSQKEPSADAAAEISETGESEISQTQTGTIQPKKRNVFIDALINIVKNPLIIGVAVGLLFVGIREIERAACGGELPFTFKSQLKFLYVAVSDLKAIASPLALIVLGGEFEFSAVKGMTKEIVLGTVLRIIVTPLIGIGGAILLSKTRLVDFGADVYPTLIALFGTPVAVSSAIMAGEMKGDKQLATQLVVWTSLISILTVFLMVFALMSFGLISV